jgi:hypothetical protein
MIYVLIQEDGEYSDYRKTLLYASADKAKMESKLAELKEQDEQSELACKEQRAFYDTYSKRRWPPRVDYSTDEEYMAATRELMKIDELRYAESRQALAYKYQVPVSNVSISWTRNHAIEEVEEL